MKEILQSIAQILGHIQSWRGYRGAIVFVVDIDTTQNSFALKSYIHPDLTRILADH